MTKPYGFNVAESMSAAINYYGKSDIRRAYLMGKASYLHSRFHGLTIIESMSGAVECAWFDFMNMNGRRND